MTLGTFAVAQLVRVLPRAHITRAVGMLCDLALPPPVSRAVVGAYVSAFRVDLEEAALPNGGDAYPSFDAFFTRKLRNGARSCTTETAAVVSPADGRLQQLGRIEGDGKIRVKGHPYCVGDLLGDDREADRYVGGQYAVVYLSPRDYHRVHAPATGRVVEVRSMPGDLYPVNSVGQRHIPRVLVRNRRVAIVMDTSDLARITVVMIAAMFVGRITVTGLPGRDVPLGRHVPDTPLSIARGEELGIFHLGSTVVVFSEHSLQEQWVRPLGPVRIGDPLAAALDETSGGAFGGKS